MKKYGNIFFVLIFLVFLFSCRKDKLITDSSAKLDFSRDSILYDTVFTTVGSTTKNFLVYNKNNKKIKISKLYLGAGNNSQFRINVDGAPTISTTDIEIPANDSIWVFVEVTVNPTNQNSPLIIRDSVVFETNGNQQSVQLEAWGQDAYYYKPTNFIYYSDGSVFKYSVISCNSTWANDKPHVIYDYAVVDSGCKLTMMPGTRVYLHKGGVLWVYKAGTLDIQGTLGNEVTFQGDRLEQEFKDVPGQWGKIWLSAGSKNNKINYAIIKNGGIGIQTDTVAMPNPTLMLSNTIIENMSAAALYGQGAHIRAYNCVFANCGQYCAALTIGGEYSFRHCTFANYYNFQSGTRTSPAVLINNWYKDVNDVPQSRSIDSAYFGNCIVYGNIDNEVGLDSSQGGNFNYKFENTLIKVPAAFNVIDGFHFLSSFKNNDPSFSNSSNNDYTLNTGSFAIDKGNISIGAQYPLDLKGVSRTASPDLGAYEK